MIEQRSDDALKQQLHVLLHDHFGHTQFRDGQEEILLALAQGTDVFAVMPTGSGKSLLYQLPGYLREGLVLIVSPLISLMEDQLRSLRAIGERRVRALNSLVNSEQRNHILKTLASLRFLFISPEMVQKSQILDALKRVRVSLFVIDEAHCVSQWGYDFRPDYLRLAAIRQTLGSPQCLALTATASERTEADICTHLGLTHVRTFIHSVDRPNIAIRVQHTQSDDEKVSALLTLLRHTQLPAIVYCSSRSWCEQLSQIIYEQTRLITAYYHGGMVMDDRMKIQHQFINQRLPVLCCTNAFGMGVNLPNLRLVVHFHYPLSIHAYMQEIGRAGRDGGQSMAVLYYCQADDRLPQRLIDTNYPDEQLLSRTFRELDQGQLTLAKEDQLAAALSNQGATPTAIRFLIDQAHTKKPSATFLSLFEQCRALIQQRRQRKLNELSEMRQWLQASGCRRAALLRLYNERQSERVQWCCDQCGLPADFLERPDPPVEESDLSVRDWRLQLDCLLGEPDVKKADLGSS
ncbi:MAG: RecQ family ATP-dependent DNA helicase [Sporolactobacillus sp.]